MVKNSERQSTTLKSDDKNFLTVLKETVTDFVKHPKKLLPTIILAFVWILFSVLSTAGVNIPIFRFLYAVTYANGGMFGGFFGAVGGIFGKAVFAAVVNGIVLSLCEKKNPFKGFKHNIPGVFSGGAKAIAPFISGAGIGILLYFFFNITSATQNCAVAVAAALAGVKALSSRGGLLFSGTFRLLGIFSKGKTPSSTTVSRIIAGLTAGFAVSFPITFIRLPILIAILGIVLTAAGILIPVICQPKTAAAGLCLLLALSFFTPYVFAENDSFTLVIDPFYKNNKDTFGYHYTDWDAWMYYSFYQAGEITVQKDAEGLYAFTLDGYDYSFDYNDGTYSVSIPSISFAESSASDKAIVFTADIGDGISANYVYSKNGNDSVTIHEMQSFELKLSLNAQSDTDGGLKAFSSDSKCVRRSYPQGTADPDSYTTWSDNASHFSQGFMLFGYDGAAASSDDGDDYYDTEYVPYRGRLLIPMGV